MEKDLQINSLSKTGRDYTEAERLQSCLTRYFGSQSGASPLKDTELSILSTLSIYFHGNTRL